MPIDRLDEIDCEAGARCVVGSCTQVDQLATMLQTGYLSSDPMVAQTVTLRSSGTLVQVRLQENNGCTVSLKIVDVDANGQPTTRVRVADMPRSASNLKYYAVFNLQLPVTAGQRVALIFATTCKFLDASGDLAGGELLLPATDSAGWQASGHDLRVELFVKAQP